MKGPNMSDNDNEALNNTAEEAVSETPTPEVETKATEEVDSQPTEVETTETDTLTKQQSKSGKGANNRIRELNAKAKQAEERAKSLEDQMQELVRQSQYNPGQNQAPPSQPNEPLVKPGEELSVEELERRMQSREARITQNVEARTRLMLEQDKVLQNIQKESSEVMTLYPQLNPDKKDDFDKDLSETIVEATMAYVRTNPTGSVKKFVSRLMKPYQKSLNKQVASNTGELVKQVAESAARPNQISKTEKSFGELSIKEMEEKLGMVN